MYRKTDFLFFNSVFILFFIGFFIFSSGTAHASTLQAVSDTISTSRPSPSTFLSADVLAGAGFVSISNNGSTFLASDSAQLFGGTFEVQNVATVAANNQTVFFTGSTANAHNKGSAIAFPITALHTIKFTTITSIPSGGSIILSFPVSNSSDTNQASPSAATFMLNGLSSSNIQTNNGNLSCSSNTGSWSGGSTPTITCSLSGNIAGNTALVILLGCSSGSSSCTTQVPTLINPTKTAAVGASDSWQLGIKSYSGASGTGTILDSGSTLISTIESVQVIAHITPNFTFAIYGVANGTTMSSVCTSNTSVTNAGFDTTATQVNLGTLLASQTNYAAQKMVITSNSVNGYTLTATSSGHLRNPANGFFIADAQGTPTNNDAPAPHTIANGGNQFGIHPCDSASKVSSGTWGTGTLDFANPSASFYYTLVNSGVAPGANGDTIYVEYGATPQGSTPPGDYQTVLTYVATSIF